MSRQRTAQRLRALIQASRKAQAAIAPSATPEAVKDRVGRHREAKEALGLKQLHGIWAHPDDHEYLRRVAQRRAARRGIEL